VDAGLPVPEPKVKKFSLDSAEAKPITDKIHFSTQITPSNEADKGDGVDVSVPEESEPFIVDKSEVQGSIFDLDEEVVEAAHDREVEPTDELEIQETEPAEEVPGTEEVVNEEVEEMEAEKTVYNLEDEGLSDDRQPPKMDNFTITSKREIELSEDRPSKDVLLKRNKEREQKIKELTLKLKTPSGLTELEDEPAFKRRNVQLDKTPHSSDSSVSRYTLSEEVDEKGDKKAQIKPNNPFLHDNVD
jgi:cell division protein FtsZ